MGGLSVGERHFIKGGIEQDLRTDGRKRLTYRPIYVSVGVIPQANGSARVKMGATDVIASVKAELGKPSASYPHKGKVFINVDCSPTAEPAFEGRGGEELSSELSTALQRCFLGGKSGAGTLVLKCAPMRPYNVLRCAASPHLMACCAIFPGCGRIGCEAHRPHPGFDAVGLSKWPFK